MLLAALTATLCLSLADAIPQKQQWASKSRGFDGHSPWGYPSEPYGKNPDATESWGGNPWPRVTPSCGQSSSSISLPPSYTVISVSSSSFSASETSAPISSAISVSASTSIGVTSGPATTVSSIASSTGPSAGSSASSSSALAPPAVGPTVTISNGVIIGTTVTQTLAASPSSTATVTQYLGIPFASNPPVRFAAPSPAAPWTAPLSATTYAPGCIAANGSSFSGAPRAQSESCLYLNIFVPPDTNPGDNLPVMSWIYGGNLAFGDAAVVYYDGSSFAADQQVILVTSNYRTNIFGFSMSPDVPIEERNAGFLDQRLALQWIQQNIASFGGDPSKVTIFGESAGGYSVEQLISFPADPPLFRGAIIESRGFGGPTNGSLPWYNALGAVDCYLSSDQLGCMRSKDPVLIENAITNQSITFGPVPDGLTFQPDIRPRITANQIANVPVFIGTNGNEGSVLASYGFSADVITLYEFTCTTSLFSQALSNASRPTWRYLYNASFPNTTPFAGAGAYHSSEIPEVFGTYPRVGATDQQIALSLYMQTAWANFAKEPTSGPGQEWPLVSTGDLFLLGNGTDTSGVAYDASIIDEPCSGGYYQLIEQVGYK